MRVARKPLSFLKGNVTVKSYLKNNSNIRMKRYIPYAYIFSKKISWEISETWRKFRYYLYS